MTALNRPKLRDSIFVVPVSDNHLQIRSGEKTLRITGAQVDLLSKVLERLKSASDVTDIATSLPEYSNEAVVSVVDRLGSMGLLEESIDPPPGFSAAEAAYYTSQLQFFSHRSSDKYKYQTALKNGRVVVIGLGRIGSVVLSNLLASGVGHILAVDPARVSAEDVGAVYKNEDVGTFRSEAAAARLGQVNPFVRLEAIAARTDSADDLVRVLEDCDLLVVCEDEPAVRIFELANTAALQKKVSWLGVNLFGVQGSIGPMVTPGETPCYQCYKLRERSNAMHFNEYVSFEQYLRDNPNHNVKQGSLRLFEGVVGSLAALEVVYALTDLADPRSRGNLLAIDMFDLHLETHPILRIPRCPACSPTKDKPKRKVYDI